MVVEKSPEAMAKEATDIIFDLRRKKMQIVTGDSDAVFSGEALGAAIAEIDRLEQEYLSLFIGYSEFIPSKMVFDVIPRKDAKNQRYIAFRLSEDEGLVPSDNVSGKPYILELVPEKVAAVTDAKASKGNVIYYRIPSICTVRLSDGVNVLISSRMPVSQLGATSTIPVK